MAGTPQFMRQTVEGPHKGEVLLDGKFRPNDASAPTAAMIFGNWISSIAHTATGKWTITMKDDFKNLIGWHSLHVTLSTATAQPTISVSGGAIDLAAGTIVIHAAAEDGVSGISAASNIAADADTFISVSLSVKYDTSPDGSNLTSDG